MVLAAVVLALIQLRRRRQQRLEHALRPQAAKAVPGPSCEVHGHQVTLQVSMTRLKIRNLPSRAGWWLSRLFSWSSQPGQSDNEPNLRLSIRWADCAPLLTRR